MRVALVHEYIVQYGGAERVLESFRELFPKAPIFTLLYDPKSMNGKFKDADIRTSFLQKIPFAKKCHRLFPALMPVAIEQFDLSYYDFVISDSSSFAKGIITLPKTKHICYCHTPMRFAWDDCQSYTKESDYPSLIKKFVPFAMNYVRIWDEVAAKRVDHFIANSNFVASRIKKYYQQESTVIYPPVDVHKMQTQSDKDRKQSKYFLVFARLLSYKNIEIAIETFNQLGLPLKIVGVGPMMKKLKKKANINIEFLGFIPDEKKSEIYSSARAFIFPQEEDFGITAVEAMACGTPVIAYKGGGALETMTEGISGIFFDEQTPQSLLKAVYKFIAEENSFDRSKIQEHVLQFDKEIFKKNIKSFINKML
ncbi:glycosyltransferase family 4 protein [bacterium]|nr:MAG: glycosyltransferase family 4 protein [bacterium]